LPNAARFPFPECFVAIAAALLDRRPGVDAASISCGPANPAWRLYIRLGFAPLEDGRTMLRVKSANHSI
jgi:hypothetical protein